MEPAVTVSEVAAFAAAGEQMPAADASGYGVPENFVPLSPFPKPAKPRDMLGLAAWGSFGVGVAAALYALFAIFTG